MIKSMPIKKKMLKRVHTKLATQKRLHVVKTTRLVARIFSAVTVGIIMLASPSIQAAKSAADLQFPYYSSTATCSVAPAATSDTALTGNKLYVLGDSLTVNMRDSGDMQTKLTAKGWSVTKINAVGGKDLRWGMDQITADKDIIDGSDAALISLGTNNLADAVNVNADTEKTGGLDVIKGLIRNIVTDLKTRPNLKIYWTDTYGTGELNGLGGKYNENIGYKVINQAINDVAGANNITVLPWSTSPIAQQYVKPGDVHPNGHYPEMADYITGVLGGPGAPPAAAPAPTATAAGTTTVGNKLFYIGDSLTYHMAEDNPNSSGLLLQKSQAAGYSVNTTFTTIGASTGAPRITGHSVEAQGGINIANSITHIDEHPADWGDSPDPQDSTKSIANADIIVIGLGTNLEAPVAQLPAALATQIHNITADIRIKNTHNPQIYWVNTYFSVQKTNYQIVNTAIATASDPKVDNFHVIDYATEAAKNSAIAPPPFVSGGADGIHINTTDGRQKKADWIISQLPKPGSAATDGGSATTPSAGCSCTTGGTDNGATIIPVDGTITFGAGVWTTGSPIYKSGLQPPYDIEQWAISVLRNIALKSGKPEADIVTQEKVLALVAWAHAEGGGVDGHNGDFNPLNTKRSDPDVHGTNQGNAATDSNSSAYPTFDQGVEAVTRAIFAKVQSRIGSALLSPNLTAEDLMSVIAGDFYSTTGKDVVNRLAAQYPGNLEWATLSITGYNYGGGIGDRTVYLNAMLGAVKAVRGNYEKYAGKLMNGSTGTPAPLVYTATGTTGAVLTSSGCAAGAAARPADGNAANFISDCGANDGNAAIACTAINQLSSISYPNTDAGQRSDGPTVTQPTLLDCSGLTNMAIYRTFGVRLDLCSAQYQTDSHFENLDGKNGHPDITDIKPGDFVGIGTACHSAGGTGHIAIVVSYDKTTKKLKTMEASSTKWLSGVRGTGASDSYNVGLKADGGSGTFEWAVRYVGDKTIQPGAL
jgi:GDSL-like Lipase/Acylhydrolase family